MIKPKVYYQVDPQWKDVSYSAKGESTTIGRAGCGTTCAAMVIASLMKPSITPVDTSKWSVAHGYKCINWGTYYSYFVPQFKKYKIDCKMLNSANLRTTPNKKVLDEALEALKDGQWLIACMGPGNWTKGGHFILVYGYNDGYVYINDPASSRANRVKNTWTLLAKEVKYFWVVDLEFNRFVKEVQNTCGSKPDMIPGPKTLAKTVDISAKENSNHPVVKPLQKYLKKLKFYTGKVDGIYGNKLKDAIKKYQKSIGVKETGTLKSADSTWKHLLHLD